MPQRKPNQIARVLAVLTLIGAFVLVVATIATSGGDSGGDNGGDDDEVSSEGPTRKGERALERGVWVVGEGDTLVSISEETAIDLTELEELNSDIDPQVLITGQRISLRPGAADGGETGAGATGSGVGDEGPTGQDTETGSEFD